MPVGDPGNESHQFVPNGPHSRVYTGKRVLGGYDRSRTYDPSTPASNTLITSTRGDFSKDLSQGKFSIFLQSPRVFWMRYVAGFESDLDSPSFTINTRVGRLAEATTDALRAQTPIPTVGSIPFFSGTAMANMRPFVHPTDPAFIVDILGRHPSREWMYARSRGILYGRTGIDPYPRLNVYGMPDDLLEYEDEHGQSWIVLVDYKSVSTSDLASKVSTWWQMTGTGSQPYHANYITQLEFYAWYVEQLIQQEGLPHRVHPTAYHVIFNVGHGGTPTTLSTPGDMRMNLDSAVASHDMDWSWIEPTLDLAIECLLDPSVPPKQGIPPGPTPTGRASRSQPKYHDFDVMDNRYDWLQTNHPGSWP